MKQTNVGIYDEDVALIDELEAAIFEDLGVRFGRAALIRRALHVGLVEMARETKDMEHVRRRPVDGRERRRPSGDDSVPLSPPDPDLPRRALERMGPRPESWSAR